MATITLLNSNQIVLFKTELSGQISDGYWSNSKPLNHWKTPCSADLKIGDIAHVDFTPARKYNFANKELLEFIGDRMLMYVRAHIKCPDMSMEALLQLDTGSWIHEERYAVAYAKLFEEWSKYGITDHDSKIAFMNELVLVNYTMKELRKDLNVIGDAFKTRK